MKIKLTAGSKYIRDDEEQAIKRLDQLLAAEDGYLLPIMFIGKQVTSREIDAILLLPDALFLLDFKCWFGEQIEVDGINGGARQLVRGVWKEGENTLANYQYAARELANRLRKERWLPSPRPYVYSIMVFTEKTPGRPPQVSFAGGRPDKPEPLDGVGACSIEQLPQMLAAFRAAPDYRTATPLDARQQAILAKILLNEAKPVARPTQHYIDEYLVIAEHHTDTFLDCKIYLAETEPIKEPIWIKEYNQVLATPAQQSQREQLVLRHADVLSHFPQHRNIVNYRISKSTPSHLYIILSRKPGAFLSELLTQIPYSPTTIADLQRIPFDLNARLHILGDLLAALEYLTQQPGFERSAYRDLRPDSIFVQYTDTTPVAQLFNFDCTKLPGAVTRLGHLKAGSQRSPLWDDYASPELLEYIDAGQSTPGIPASFSGDIKSDLFSWACIAWELLTGELPFPDTDAKLTGKRRPWRTSLAPTLQQAQGSITAETLQLIEACLEHSPDKRPHLTTLRRHFP